MNLDSSKVKALRKAKQWSQDQLADACGINLRTIQRGKTLAKVRLKQLEP
ncbi:helix-turn-helix domain-containing protein [Kangiella sp. TOML190]|nr:helix-turn-helix transcriptional regulator [Kangiella sp. TOML190]